MRLDQIFEYIDTDFDNYLEALKDFIACPSTASCEKGREDARTFLLDTMKAAGIPARRIPVQTDSGNDMIVGKVAGKRADKTVLLYNHYDVVEGGDPARWQSGAPYKLCREGEMLYGRGVSDNKGVLLSRIFAIRAILKVCGALPVNVTFLDEGDEESASPSMTRYQQEHPEEYREITKADLCLWENGRIDEQGRPWARFGVRGAMAFDISVRTARKDVHGRLGAAVPNAAWRLIWALNSIKDEQEHVLIDDFYDDVLPITETDERILAEFPYDEEELKSQLDLKEYVLGTTGETLKKRLYYTPSVSVCGLEAGEMYNGPRGIVPCKASARVSFYLVAEQKPEKLKSALLKHLKDKGFEDVEVKFLGTSDPVRTPLDTDFREMILHSAKQAYSRDMVIEPTMLGSGPAFVIKRAWEHMPVIGIGPGNTSANHHGPNENIRIKDIKDSMKHLVALLYEIAAQNQ